MSTDVSKVEHLNKQINDVKLKSALNKTCYATLGAGAAAYGGSVIGNVFADGVSKLLPKGLQAEKLRTALNGEYDWFGQVKAPWLRYTLIGLGAVVCGAAAAISVYDAIDKIKDKEIKKLEAQYKEIENDKPKDKEITEA